MEKRDLTFLCEDLPWEGLQKRNCGGIIIHHDDFIEVYSKQWRR
jgi:hypothetical protein